MVLNLGDGIILRSLAYILSMKLTSAVVWMVVLADLLGFFKMVKRGRKPAGGKGKQPSSEMHQKRGRKSTQQHLEPLVQTFMAKIPNSVRSHIYGWETEVLNNIDMEDVMALEDMQTVITDPVHTQGRTSLFQQSVRTY